MFTLSCSNACVLTLFDASTIFPNTDENGISGSMPPEICNLRNTANGAIFALNADRCDSPPKVVCDSTCCTNSCE